jgi:transposase-like protein
MLKEAIVAKLEAGDTVHGIARKLGCTRRYVYMVRANVTNRVSNRVDIKSTREKENE